MSKKLAGLTIGIAAFCLSLSGCSATSGPQSDTTSASQSGNQFAATSRPTATPSAPNVAPSIDKSQLTADQTSECDSLGVDQAVQNLMGNTTAAWGGPSLGRDDPNFSCEYTNSAGAIADIERISCTTVDRASLNFFGISSHLDNKQDVNVGWSQSAVVGNFGEAIAAGIQGTQIIQVGYTTNDSAKDAAPETLAAVVDVLRSATP